MKTFLRRLVKELKDFKSVRAIVVHGSASYGKLDKYSDIDLVCIVDRIPSKFERKKILTPISGEVKGLFRMDDLDIIEYGGKSIGIDYRTIRYFKKAITTIAKKIRTTISSIFSNTNIKKNILLKYCYILNLTKM